ncbi:MAG TPA: S41 family peptidase, partial [Flammeovirgaceae bacterium]|nr:S41 family peptidase [Flammeovirgaceae bacterium]
MKKAWRIFLIMFIALLGFALTPPGGRYFEIAKNLDIFANIYREVNEYYVDEINPTQLMNKGINAMLQDLDPYTNYISEDMIEDFRTANTGQYAGIGASTITLDGRIFVTMVYEGFSAYKNGLRIGDEILTIDGVPVKGLSEERIEQLMKGQLKSRVGLRIKRPENPEPLELVFEREKIKIPNVPYSNMLTDEVGYIKFTEFTPDGYKNVKKALMALMRQGADAIVLDLRDNLGGLLTEAVDITNLFIPEGELVVETRGKLANNNYTYKTRNTPLAPDLKLTVLVNHMSASASEIVAGTLQDYDRAVIIGNKTYGKGLVQNARDLPYNGKVKITIARYYTPSGRCIQAIDYSHKQNGRPVQLPDSLKKAFYTRNGRVVYDGGGI